IIILNNNLILFSGRESLNAGQLFKFDNESFVGVYGDNRDRSYMAESRFTGRSGVEYADAVVLFIFRDVGVAMDDDMRFEIGKKFRGAFVVISGIKHVSVGHGDA